MNPKPSILLKQAWHTGQQDITVLFDFNSEIADRLRQTTEARWSKTTEIYTHVSSSSLARLSSYGRLIGGQAAHSQTVMHKLKKKSHEKISPITNRSNYIQLWV